MVKNYDAKNTGRDGRAHKVVRQPKCKTCADARQVRVSRPRHAQGKTARQQYDIVWEKCPDCK
jgi:hypothetical protein